MKALDWAVEHAVAQQRPLSLVHSLGDPTPRWSDVAIINPEGTRAALEKEGWNLLDADRDRVLAVAPDLEVWERVEFADARHLLLRMADGAAMLVLGSRGLGPVRSLLLGSVGAAAVRHASCPVVIHRPMKQGVVRNGVLVATDASEYARPVLEFAFELASIKDLPLTVLHCEWDVPTMARHFDDLSPADTARDSLELSEALAGMGEKYPDVHVTRTVVEGPPERIVAKAAQRMDVLVVGADRGSRLGRMLYGSMSMSLVEHAPCTVAVVPVSGTEDTDSED